MATLTTTTTGQVVRNPKDSMKSTWREDKKQWGYHHWMIELTGMHYRNEKRSTPVHQKSERMPHMSDWSHHRWVLVHACWPLLVNQLYIWYFGKNMHVLGAFVLYTLAYKLNGISELNALQKLGHMYGFLDGDKHDRDGIPDHAVPKVFNSLVLTSTLRPLMSLFFAWSANQSPLGMSPWVILEIGLYGIVLDFWFYWYHRCMHHFEDLWRFHRTHHLTKHPNPLLTLYADMEQEIFDIMVIPLMTYGSMKLMGLPMGFYEWWLCHQYVVYTELWGHSGIRAFSTPPSTMSWFLEYFDAQLAIEDHDLHHRKGWKKSHNYGKQTRLWDRVFGTCHERYESLPENIDYDHPVHMPLFTVFNNY